MEKKYQPKFRSESDRVTQQEIPGARRIRVTREEVPIERTQDMVVHPYHVDERGDEYVVKVADVAVPDPEMEFLETAVTRYKVLTNRLNRLLDHQKTQATVENKKEIDILQEELAEVNGRIGLGLKVVATKADELQAERKFFMSRGEMFPEYSVTLEYINFQLKRLEYLKQQGAQILSQQESSDVSRQNIQREG